MMYLEGRVPKKSLISWMRSAIQRRDAGKKPPKKTTRQTGNE